MGHFEMEYFPFFVGLDQIITSMKFIFDYRFSVFPSQTFRIGFFCLLRVHCAYHLLPFLDGIALTSFSIDEDHDQALAAHHVSEYILEVGFVLVFVVEIGDLLFEKFPLEHIFDGQFFAIFDEVDDLLEFLWLEDGVGFDEGDCEGEVDLFGVEENLIHS